jgi:hypothetical protein
MSVEVFGDLPNGFIVVYGRVPNIFFEVPMLEDHYVTFFTFTKTWLGCPWVNTGQFSVLM